MKTLLQMEMYYVREYKYILKVHILVSSEHKLCQIWNTCIASCIYWSIAFLSKLLIFFFRSENIIFNMFFSIFSYFFNSFNFYLHALIISTHLFLSIKYLHIIPELILLQYCFKHCAFSNLAWGITIYHHFKN
jgi:hypothetical protein